MPKFKIEVEFSGTASFEVEAENEDEALEIAQDSDWVESYGAFHHVDWDVKKAR